MTPTQFITAARNKYNSVGRTFYSDDEILILLYQAEMELSKIGLTIEKTDSSTTTVVGTRSYSFPTRAIGIKRLLYDDQKLKKISFRNDDKITLFDEGTADTGTPLYYEQWGEEVFLRPVPDDTKVLKFYFYREPAIITVSDTIETPDRFHMDMVDFCVAEMAYKDENFAAGDRYTAMFAKHLIEARKWQRKRQVTDEFHSVNSDEDFSTTVLGPL